MRFSRFRLNTAALTAALALAGCASDTPAQIGAAATTPLSDLNVVHTEIPPVLAEAQQKPYLLPTDQSCDALIVQVHQLDDVLGADLDAAPGDPHPRAGELVGHAAAGALQRTAEGIVPFRGWVRKLSGAERQAEHVARAIAAGNARRAFLKGVGATRSCNWDQSVQAAAAAPHVQ